MRRFFWLFLALVWGSVASAEEWVEYRLACKPIVPPDISELRCERVDVGVPLEYPTLFYRCEEMIVVCAQTEVPYAFPVWMRLVEQEVTPRGYLWSD